MIDAPNEPLIGSVDAESVSGFHSGRFGSRDAKGTVALGCAVLIDWLCTSTELR